LLVGCVVGLLVTVRVPPIVGEAAIPDPLVVGVTAALETPVAALGSVVSVGDVESLEAGPNRDDTDVAEQVPARVQSVLVGTVEASDCAWESVRNREKRRSRRVKGSNSIVFFSSRH